MIVNCPSCKTRFRVPDGQAQEAALRFRCTRCQTLFALGATRDPAARSPDTASTELPAVRGVDDARSNGLPPARIATATLTSSRAAAPGDGGPGAGGHPPASAPLPQPHGLDESSDLIDLDGLPAAKGFRDQAVALQTPPPRSADRMAGLPAPRGLDEQSGEHDAARSPGLDARSSDPPPEPKARGGFRARAHSAAASNGDAGSLAAAPGVPRSPGFEPATSEPGPHVQSLPASRGIDMSSMAATVPSEAIDADPPEPKQRPSTSLSDEAFLRGLEDTGLSEAAESALRAPPEPADPFATRTPAPGSLDGFVNDAAAGSPSAGGAAPDQKPAGSVMRSRSAEDFFGAGAGAPGGRDVAHTRPAATPFANDLDGLVGQASKPADPAEAAGEGDERRPTTDDQPPDGERAARPIDPMVEFHDVFQDIRRAEKGDDLDASERYFDSNLFATSLDGLSSEARAEREAMLKLEQEERQRRVSRGELDLRGGLGDRLTGRPDGLPNQRLEESDLIAAALDDAGLREPSQEHLAARERAQSAPAGATTAERTKTADAPAYPPMADADPAEAGGRLASAALAILLTIVGSLAYVASKNDWLLDFRESDQMIGVAFRGEEYRPRAVQLVRVVETDGGWVGEPIDVAPVDDAGELSISGLTGGVYRTTDDRDFVVVDGVVANRGDTRFRRIEVVVELVDDRGSIVSSMVVPAGNEIAQPALEALTDAEQLDALYETLRETAAELLVEPGQQTPFSGVFPTDGRDLRDLRDLGQLTYAARLHIAQREIDSCWADVRISPAEMLLEPISTDTRRGSGRSGPPND